MTENAYFIAGQKYDSLPSFDDVLARFSEAEEFGENELSDLREDARRYVDDLFKFSASEHEKVHIRTMGTPLAGSSTLAKELYDSLEGTKKHDTILVAYDENGAIECFAGYQNAKSVLAAQKDQYTDEEYYAERMQVRDRYRLLSQIVRDYVLARAIEEGYSIIEDTTGSSPHTIAGWEKSRAAGYEGRTFFSYIPFAEAFQRIWSKNGRFRNLDIDEELIQKRFMVLANLPAALDYAVQNNETLVFQNTTSNQDRAVRSTPLIHKGEVQTQNATLLMHQLVINFFNDLSQAHADGYFERHPDRYKSAQGAYLAFKDKVYKTWGPPQNPAEVLNYDYI